MRDFTCWLFIEVNRFQLIMKKNKHLISKATSSIFYTVQYSVYSKVVWEEGGGGSFYIKSVFEQTTFILILQSTIPIRHGVVTDVSHGPNQLFTRTIFHTDHHCACLKTGFNSQQSQDNVAIATFSNTLLPSPAAGSAKVPEVKQCAPPPLVQHYLTEAGIVLKFPELLIP